MDHCLRPPEKQQPAASLCENHSRDMNRLGTKQELIKSAEALLESTTPHVLQKRKVVALIWAVIYLGAIFCLLFQAYDLFEDYFGYPTNINIDVLTWKQIDFPAVTVCNINPLRKSYVLRDRKYRNIALLDNYLLSLMRIRLNESSSGDSCPPNEFYKCSNPELCIPYDWVCDSQFNCDDKSDEIHADLNCTDINIKRNENITTIQGNCIWPAITCPGEQICALPCNGVFECAFGFDEGLSFGCNSSFLTEKLSTDYQDDIRSDLKMDSLNYFQLYNASTLDDLSDLREYLRFDRDVVEAYGTQGRDFIVQCSYNGENCDHNDFFNFQDPVFGNCFSFNSDQSWMEPFQSRIAKKPGVNYGLKLTLFLDVEDYIGMTASFPAAIVAKHIPAIYPDMFTKGSPVSPGFAAFMALQKKEIVRKGGKYGNCTTEWPRGLHLNPSAIAKSPVYNREDCLYFCRLNDLARTCGCIDSFDQFYSTDSSINNASLKFCDNFDSTQRNCRINVESKSQNGFLDCPCPHPCTSIMFTTQQSLVEWPGETYAPFVVNRLLERSNSTRVKSYLTRVLTTKNLTNENIIEKIRSNFVRVEVFYEHITFERIWETPAYDISSLLSDFGGSLGLWLGWSVLIVFQLAHFFSRVALIYARKLIH